MNKVNIHFDGNVFHRQPHGGISRVFLNLLRELSELDDLHLHLHLWSDKVPSPLPDSVSLHHIPSEKTSWPDRIRRKCGLSIPRHIDRYFSGLGPGIFHSTYYSAVNAPALKTVYTLHDMIFEDHPECFPPDLWQRHTAEKKYCLERADAVVCDSQATLDRLFAHHPDEKELDRYSVIYLGVDPTIQSAGAQPPCQAPYVLHVGGRSPHKNFNRVIEAMGKKELEGLHLVSVGGGDWKDDENELIEKHCPGRAICVPQASDSQLASAYEGSAVVVVPSISEGFGLPLLEAMQHTARIASSRGGSLPEVGGDIPVYCDLESVDSIAKAIQEASIRDNRDYEDRIANHLSRFSWKKTALEYAAIYHALNATNGALT